MARVVSRALIVLVGLAACVAVVVTALLVADSRETAPQPVDIDLAPAIATVPASPPQLDDVVGGRRTELARGIDEEAYARARADRDQADGRTGAPAPSAWRGGSLVVRVVQDEDGAPIQGATLILTLKSAQRVAVANRVSDETGTARFEGLCSDIWMVVANAHGRRERVAWVPIHEAFAAWEEEIRLVRAREVVVRVVDDAGRTLAPIEFQRMFGERARVFVVATRRSSPIGAALDPGESRSWSVPSRSPDADSWTIRVEGVDDKWVLVLLGTTTIGCAQLHAAAESVDVRIALTVLRDLLAPLSVLVLEDSDGLPVAGALVAFEPRGPGARAESRTGSNGCARTEEFVERGTPYTVTAAGFATQRGSLDVPLGGQLVVRLAPGRRIQGVLRDENDRPLVRATVALHEADDSGARLARGAPTLLRTGPDGAFAFDGLEARAYAVGGRGDLRTESGEVDRPADFVFVDCREKDALDVVVRRVAVPRPAASARGPR